MRFRRAARAVLTGQSCSIQILVAVVILAGLTLSCGTNEQSSPLPGPNHYAYMTLPSTGSVLQVQINGATGAITVIAQTPQVQGSSPLGLALTPSGKFLYAVNSRANTISIFNVG